MTSTSSRPGPAPAAGRARFPVGLTLATLVALAVLVSLGVWQIKRLHWKEAILSRIAALQHAQPVPLQSVLGRVANGADVDYTRVSSDCPALQQGPVVRLYAVVGGAGGSRIITACPLSGGGPYSSILVDRGFWPGDLESGSIPAPGPAISQPVVGVLRHGEGRNFVTPENVPAQRLFYYRDVAAMAGLLGAARPAPVFLMLESPAPPAGGPTPAAVPVDIPNNHLQYAVTWFGLAAGLLCVYLASLWRRLRSS